MDSNTGKLLQGIPIRQKQNGSAQNSADRALHRLFGADVGAELVPSAQLSRKESAGIGQPRAAEHHPDQVFPIFHVPHEKDRGQEKRDVDRKKDHICHVRKMNTLG